MLQGEPCKIRSACEVWPSACVQYDSVSHLPEFDDKEEKTQCKNCTTNRTHIYCVKCQVHFCFVKGRNCFSASHDQWFHQFLLSIQMFNLIVIMNFNLCIIYIYIHKLNIYYEKVSRYIFLLVMTDKTITLI